MLPQLEVPRDHDEANHSGHDCMIPSGATYTITPGSHRRSMKSRIVSILKDHQHELLDAVNLEEMQAARERIAHAIVDELP